MKNNFSSKENIKFAIKSVLCLFICFVLSLVYFKRDFKENVSVSSGFLDNFHKNETTPRPLLYQNFNFYPVNDQGVYSFWNVCIEDPGYLNEVSYGGFKYNETQRIAIYNSFYRVGDQNIKVAASPNSEISSWDAIFFRGPIPSTHTFHKTTAFFIILTCPSNFHHFWIDQFVSLFSVVRRGNRLKEKSNNQLFYRALPPRDEKYLDDCHNTKRYKKILETLYLGGEPKVFYQAAKNTCYSSAVFGSNTKDLKDPRSIINHTISYILKHSPLKKPVKDCTVIIQDRKQRRMLNIDELVAAAKSVGFKNVCKVLLEKLTIEEQLLMASKAHLMVGVQGSGLQWAVFMPKGSVLLEIAWPHKHWGFFFQPYVSSYAIKYARLATHNIKVNWTSYEKRVRGGRKVGKAERTKMLQGSGFKSAFDNLWKWADVKVDVAAFKDVISAFL